MERKTKILPVVFCSLCSHQHKFLGACREDDQIVDPLPSYRKITQSKISHFSIKLKTAKCYSISFAKGRGYYYACRSRKYPYSPPPHRRDWNFLGGGGFCETKKIKEMCEALLEFPEGWGGLRKNPFRGKVHVWIFSGTTQCSLC